MIRNTLVAIKNIRYPHNSFLCDEGNDPGLRRLCFDLGIHYITRKDNKDAKAGNINNALFTAATGDICVILDPDHQPLPNFLDTVLPFFENEKVGFVQIVQAYANSDASFIAKGAAQQTYGFYGPLMMGMNCYGTVQALGANCTFRREALDSIGGHAPGLAEDMHTAMRLHAEGWESVYVPQILTHGLVPATLPAYYKQQLKWSRGTFELLMTVFPILFSSFSWRQKLHYFLLPLHFASGIITLIDLSIPVIALLTGFTPIHIDFSTFLLSVTPFAASVILIRQYSQKWHIEKHENGLHIRGGITLLGTWWIHILGFVYTLFRIEVPYIATPKDDKPTNNLLLSLPNIIACIICIGAVYYGLSYDWTPYSLYMAFFAASNATLLLIFILAGQHQLFYSLKRTLTRFNYLSVIRTPILNFTNKIYPSTYNILQQGAPIFIPLIFICCCSANLASNLPLFKNIEANEQNIKNVGGYYVGLYSPDIQDYNSLIHLQTIEQSIQSKFNIVSIYEFWGPESLENFPDEILTKIAKKGAIPMITWEPYVSSFPERADRPELRYEQKGLAAISEGKFDDYLQQFALKIRAYDKPVFIRFAHEPDNPAYPWSKTGKNTPEEYKAAWRKVVSTFAALGVHNVTWIWNPWDPGTFNEYYPGDQYVDWIGITSLNYGKASDNGKWRSFSEIYDPFRSDILRMKKPVMLAEFGSTDYGGNKTEWINTSLQTIANKYKEVRSIVFFNSNKDKNWITNWRPDDSTQFIDWTITDPKAIAASVSQISANNLVFTLQSLSKQTSAHNVAINQSVIGGPGNFQLVVKGKPFYIKGIAYNPMHSWRDGHYPLTRKQVDSDFKMIKEMGGNTIRRYHPSIYDKNILTSAEQHDLKVVYGFWFDPDVDYYRDTLKVQEYIELVEEKVIKFRDSPAVLAWTLGNETSGLLKKKFNQPYLGIVRRAYISMIEKLAQRIHALDPNRPVITALEHSWQLPGELVSYHQLAPSIDIIGINSYYDEQISKVKSLVTEFDKSRPYIISEFGPSGYWNPEYTTIDKNKELVEEDDIQKAELYTKEWHNYVLNYKGYNLGGFAFSWKDRYEGTATWFGLTDFRGRKKPALLAMKNAWLNQTKAFPLPKVTIVGPNFRVLPGKEYKFIAHFKSSRKLRVEWKLYKDDYVQELAHIKEIKDSSSVYLTIPKGVNRCRLYAYVYDENGNVTTASKTINIFRY
ncbi:glycosyltransferase family 2 protein [Pontibacter burrus]|uniref:Glycosyltransferase n=1 Tax=Pontibacter burrus TaxID=2704466 RepID=A0A6B3LUW8_9BACT|nr:glycosyltransferase family 2 protein [Pontibacter burrus]NEM97758.1 glycosyltransferase [Pontibacter burrus]